MQTGMKSIDRFGTVDIVLSDHYQWVGISLWSGLPSVFPICGLFHLLRL